MSIFVADKSNVTMKSDQSRVQSLLRDTITLLCRNSLNFTKELKVQGLLGITIDNDSIFIVHINETFVAGYDEMSLHNSEMKDLDYNEVDSSMKGRPEFRKRMVRGSGRIRNTPKKEKDNQIELQVDPAEKYGSNFVTNTVGFVENSAENHMENHQRISTAETDFLCEEDAKQFSLISANTNSLSSQNTKTLCHQLAQSSSGYEQVWKSKSNQESVLKPKVIKNEPSTAIESDQFVTSGHDVAVIVPDDNFAEVDKLFVDGSNDLGYALNPDQTYIHSSVFSDSDTGFSAHTSRNLTVPSEYEQNSEPSNTPSFQCLSKSSRTIGRSGFNSSNMWKNNKKAQKSHRFQPNALVVTKSFHICGYPDCGKQFYHRRHLLRHQTQKHGRVPTRVFSSPRKMWAELQSVQGNSDDCY